MNIMLTNILPVYMLVLAGFITRHLNIIKKSWVDALIGYVYYIALPAMIIMSIVNLHLSSVNFIKILSVSSLILVINAVLCFLVIKMLNINHRYAPAFFLAGTVGNSLYLGIPLTTSTLNLDPKSTSYAITVLIGVFLLIGSIILSLIVAELYIKEDNKFFKNLASLLKNPLIIAIAVGIVIAVLPRYDFLDNTLIKSISMIALTASPLALFALGSYLRNQSIIKNYGVIVGATAWKLLVAPVIAIGALSFLSLPDYSANAIVLYTAMPTAVTALMIAKAYNFNMQIISSVILVSTALSVITVSVFLIVLHL